MKAKSLYGHFLKNVILENKATQEINFVDESNGEIFGYEFLWNSKKDNFPQKFIETNNAENVLINRDNFRKNVKI